MHIIRSWANDLLSILDNPKKKKTHDPAINTVKKCPGKV